MVLPSFLGGPCGERASARRFLGSGTPTRTVPARPRLASGARVAGRRWLTARDVGLCLGYAEARASDSINTLFHRHADEFGPEDSLTIKLMGNPQGGNPNVRIFSHTGCVLLAMFANTPRANDFRAWAKRVLAGREAAALPAAPVLPAPRVTRRVERLILEGYVRGQSQKQLAREYGIATATVSMIIGARYRFAPGAGADETTPALWEAVAARKIAQQARQLAALCASRANLGLAAAHERRAGPMLNALERAMAAPAAQPALPGLEG